MYVSSTTGKTDFRPKLHSDSWKAVPRRTNALEITLHPLSEEGKTLPVSPKPHS